MPAPMSPAAQAQIRVDMQFMFSNHKGVHKPRLEKRQRKLLEKVSFIGRFLEPDERVLLVTPCVSPTSLFEQLTTGVIFAYINRALLVVTNKGLFHVPTSANFKYRFSIAKIRYVDCKEVRIRRGYLLVQYGDGKKERYLYLPRAQRLKLKGLFEQMKLGAGTKVGKLHLCPRCTGALSDGVYQCPKCRLPFKNWTTAMKLSILLPGGGYFYTGHPFLGIGDFFVETMLLLFVVAEVVGIFQGDPESPAAAVLFGVALVLEKLLTIHHAKRYIGEFIPEYKKVQAQPTSGG